MAAEPPVDIEALVAAAVQRHLAELTAQPVVRRVVLFDQTLAGPRRGRDGAEAALRDAGFNVRSVDCPFGDDAPAAEISVDDDGAPVFESDDDRMARIRAEQAKAWLVAETTSDEQPNANDQNALMDRATDAVRRFGFELRMHGVTWSRTSEGS